MLSAIYTEKLRKYQPVETSWPSTLKTTECISPAPPKDVRSKEFPSATHTKDVYAHLEISGQRGSTLAGTRSDPKRPAESEGNWKRQQSVTPMSKLQTCF